MRSCRLSLSCLWAFGIISSISCVADETEDAFRYVDRAGCAIYRVIKNVNKATGKEEYDDHLLGSGFCVSYRNKGRRGFHLATCEHVTEQLLHPLCAGVELGFLSETNSEILVRIPIRKEFLHILPPDKTNDIAIIDITTLLPCIESKGGSPRFIEFSPLPSAAAESDPRILPLIRVVFGENYQKLGLSITNCEARCYSVGADAAKTNVLDIEHDLYRTPIIHRSGSLIQFNDTVEMRSLVFRFARPVKHTIHRLDFASEPGESGAAVYYNDKDGQIYLIGMVILSNGVTTGMIPVSKIRDNLASWYAQVDGEKEDNKPQAEAKEMFK